MAEFVIGVVGLAVAVPGVAVAFGQCGEYIKTLASEFANAPDAIQKIGGVGNSLYQGKLKLDLELAEWAFSAENVDIIVKDAVEDSLSHLRSTLIEVASTLDGFFDGKGNVRRAYFALVGERKIARALNEMRRWQSDFESIVDLIDKKRRLVPQSLLLGREKLRIIHKANGQDYAPILGSSHFVADCEYLKDGVQKIKVLVEKQVMSEHIEHNELKTTVSTLASRLCTNTARQGILRCLGYREKKNVELIFELPQELRSLQTLSTAIAESQGNAHRSSPLQERVRLGRELCEAVLCVHTSGLVHKNVRPNTVLLVQEEADSQNSLGSAYLTHWSMLRKAAELSSWRGSDDWTEDFNRHPRRHGRQPEERYNMGHDLYSLGILLVEISLWESFVHFSREPAISEIYKKKVIEIELIPPNEESSVKKLMMPLVINKAMISFAEVEVASRMGTPFANFILTCLTCLDDRHDGLKQEDFKQNPTMAALTFRELMVQTFEAMPTA